MDKINRLNNIVSILRDQIRNKKSANKSSASKLSGKDNREVNTSSAVSNEDIEQQIRRKLQKLDKHAVNYNEKASKIVIESILSMEFGENIINDREFSEFLNSVYENFRANKNTHEKLNQLIGNLN